MIFLGRLFRLTLVATFAIRTWPALADDPLDKISKIQNSLQQQQQQIDALRGALAEMRADNGLLAQMLKNIIATQQAMLAAAQAAAIPEAQRPSQLKTKIDDAKKTADAALNAFNKLPDGSIDPTLKGRILACITAANGAANTQLAAPTPDPTKLVRACSADDLGSITDELNKARKAALDAWDKCRNLVMAADPTKESALPIDPSGLSPDAIKQLNQNLEDLKKVYESTKAGPVDCADTLKKSLDNVQAQDSASAALGSALALAGQVCLSCGGNPYVCAGLLVFAILLELFGDKGKGGGGQGNGAGPGEGSVSGGDVGGKDVHIAPVGAPDAGTFGKAKDGNIGCNATGTVLSCWLLKAPAQKLTIDPSVSIADSPVIKELQNAIQQKQADRFFFCSQDGSNFVRGILLMDGTSYYPISASYIAGTLRLAYPPAKLDLAGAQLSAALCSTAFQ